MPFLWAEHSRLFDSRSYEDMFYPQGITLSKKEKLSVIWLAANYDPEKYKKIIPARDCENVNIARICHAIINPMFPYALRLSAQLMLGTVRIYRTKTKMLLSTAEQMMVKLSTMLKEVNLKSCDLPVTMLKVDAITLPNLPNYGSIIDYSLDPVYFDANMLLHMDEGDFFPMNNTPLQSPVKFEKLKKLDKKSFSPLTVSNRQISLDECALTPSKAVVQLPGEEEFEGNDFGPAQAEFLKDLNFDNVPSLKLNYKKRLAPLFENEEDVNLTKKRKEEPDVIDVLLPLEADIGVSFIQNEADTAATLPTNFADETTLITSVREEKTVVGEKQDWNCNLFTPADAIILKPKASNPKKKRKLYVDGDIILSSQEMKSNMATPDTLIRIPIVAGTALPNAKFLFECPSYINVSKNMKLKSWWDNNSCLFKVLSDDLKLSDLSRQISEEQEIMKSPELVRNDDESLGSIEVARNASSSIRSLEHSAGSTLLIEKTPLNEDDFQVLSGIEDMVGIDFNEFQPPYISPRISGIGVLPHDVIVDLNDEPGLEPILEQDETLVECDDENQEMSKRFQGFQRKIQLAILDRSRVDFFDVFPTHSTSKRDAAVAFYTALNLHRHGKLRLHQQEIFGKITILAS